MLKGKVDTIIFDLDGTLTPSKSSWLRICKELGVSCEQQKLIFKDFLDKKISSIEAKRKVLKMYQASGKANKTFFTNMVLSWKLRKNAEEVISYLKSKNYHLCINTGAFDLYAKTIANKLRIKDWYSTTKFTWNKKGDLVDMDYQNQIEEKVVLLNRFVEKYNFKKRRCAVVADGDNDILLFKECGYGILIGKESLEISKYTYKKIANLEELLNVF